MAFVPSPDDKIKKLGKKEKIPAYIYADPDDPTIIYIKTNGVIEILDNSEYQVVIKDLEFEDGDIVSKYTCDFITEVTPCFVNADDILALCSGVNRVVEKKDILLHTRAASEIALYWASRSDVKVDLNTQNIKEDFYPFYMFVKYKAAVETLKEFYIGALTHPYKYKDQISDLSREEEMDFDALKALIDDLEEQADEWLDNIVTITADPEWALRGKYSYALSLEFSKPYHNTYIDKKGGGNGWSRGY